jgi:hypothetical protein
MMSMQERLLIPVALAVLLALNSASAFHSTGWGSSRHIIFRGKQGYSCYSPTTLDKGNKHSTRLYALPSTTSPQKKKLKTFQRYLEIECWKQSQLRELEPVLQAVAESCKQINRIIQRAQTDDLFGVATGKDGQQLEANVQGEVQQQLDVLCNEYMLRAFCGSGNCIQMVASEEEDEARCCSDVMVRIIAVFVLYLFQKAQFVYL